MPKNLQEVLKKYDSLRDTTGTTPDLLLEKILIPDEEAMDHATQYVHTGSLEWYDETLGRSMSCNRTSDFKVALNKDSYTFDFSLWPRKLKVNFIPKSAISPLYPLLKDARRLFFHFHPKDADHTVQLLKRLNKGFIGDMLIPFSSECEVKRLFCVFVAKKQLVMGIVPENQAVFVRKAEVIVKTLREEKVRTTYFSPFDRLKKTFCSVLCICVTARGTPPPRSRQ